MSGRRTVTASFSLVVALVITGLAVVADRIPAARPGQLVSYGNPAYHPLTPARILDTRTGLGAPAAAVGPAKSIDMQVTGAGGVPATGVGAVVLNLTGTESAGSTFVTAWPTGAARPNASNLNLTQGETRPNQVIVKVGTGGKVSLYNNVGSVHLIADVVGWFTIATDYTGLTPARILDTRTGLGGPAAAVGQAQAIDVQVTGVGGVPASGVDAVVVNLTGTEPTSSTFVTAYPAGGALPTASNLNLVPGQTAPNLAVVKVGTGGKVSLYNNAGAVHLIADVVGWFATGHGYTGVTPARILDTRVGLNAPSGPVGPGQSIIMAVLGRGGVPATGVGAVVLNLTGTQPSGATFVTAYPTDEARPNASNLNLVPGQTAPNLVIAKVGAGGAVNLYNNAGTVHLLADVVGWISDGTAAVIDTVAGKGIDGFCGDGGPATSACLGAPGGVAADAAGNVYVADTYNHRVRRVTPDGTISTVAGNGTASFCGDGGPATSACLNHPGGLAVDAAGNLYIADASNKRIRKVAPNGTISTVAGSGTGYFCGDGGPATSACLDSPNGIAVDGAGNLYIADTSNSRVRKVTPGGAISTVAGNGSAYSFCGDGGPATSACLYSPVAVAVDGAGNLYITDLGNQRIRMVAPDGTIDTIAGNGTAGLCGDGGPATSACLYQPSGLAVDAAGNLYLADGANQRVRLVGLDDTIITVAGGGSVYPTFCGDGGPATNGCLANPAAVALDPAGNLYIADFSNDRVRKVTW